MFVYGIVVYAIFLFTFLYLIGFIGNVFVPKSIDSGTQGAVSAAVLTNLALLSIFALQHSIMARSGFKRVWTKVIPKAIERSTYVLATSVALAGIFVFWQPMTATVWDAGDTLAANVLTVLFWVGWLIVLTSTFMIDHFDLFGLKQVHAHLKSRDAPPPGFLKVGFYQLVRHPIMTGTLIAFWAAPTMTTGHLLLTLATTAYIIIAVLHLEEKDLVAEIGEDYLNYKRQVPAFVPGFGKER